MNRFILLGFLLLMSIDTASQVCIKLAGNRIGPFEFQATWLARATAEPLIYLVLLFFGCSFVCRFSDAWMRTSRRALTAGV